MKNAIKNLFTIWQAKVAQKLRDKEGFSELVVVAILVIIAIVLAVVIFFPQISGWFQDVFMAGITEKTNDLFDFAG